MIPARRRRLLAPDSGGLALDVPHLVRIGGGGTEREVRRRPAHADRQPQVAGERCRLGRLRGLVPQVHALGIGRGDLLLGVLPSSEEVVLPVAELEQRLAESRPTPGREYWLY